MAEAPQADDHLTAAAVGPEHPEWLARLHTARDALLPWVARSVPLTDATVIEFGCGQGAVTCAFAPRCGRYVGIDIDPEAIAIARQRIAERDLGNVELQLVDVDESLAALRAHAGTVDVLLLYAVVEHLTVDERFALLETARDVVRPGGHIVVAELPNRLTPVDHHTTQMPFVDALPEEVLLRYAHRSPRRPFTDALADAPASARTTLARWGRGVSFHEFELVFGDLAACTIASGYASELYPARPVRLEELQLSAVLDAWRPDLPPAWSRSWIDTILTPTPTAARPSFVRPWRMRIDRDSSGGAWVRDDGRIGLAPGVRFPVRLPVATDELHIGLIADDAAAALTVHLDGHEIPVAASPNHVNVPPWSATVVLPRLADRLALSLAGGGELTFVGYAAPCGAPTGDRSQLRAWGW